MITMPAATSFFSVELISLVFRYCHQCDI